MNILCPYCNEGAVWRVFLESDITTKFRMCFECDSVWTDYQSVSEEAGSRFDLYMKALDRNPNWNDIVKVIECASCNPILPSSAPNPPTERTSTNEIS